MFSTALFVVGFLAAFHRGDAADFTGWSSPSAVGTKAGTTTAQTFAESATTVSITYTATGGVAPVAYSINTQTVTAHFAIVAATGVLSLASGKTLDYETTQSYTVEIFAIDSTTGGTFFTATATTVITITDANDVTPTFSPTTYSGSVADAAAAGTSVNTVTAADTDGTAANNVITYSIVSGSCDKFSISSTGLISVATGQTLASATNCHILVVHATDSATTGKLTGTTTVTVLLGSTTTAQCTSATAIQCSSATAITASAMTLLLALVMMLK